MKIDMKFKNYFRSFNEAEGVAMARKLILKSRNPQVTTYLQNFLLIFFFVLLTSIYLLVFGYYEVFYLVFFMDLIFLFLNIFYMLERTIRGNSIDGETSITKNGIVNNTYKNIEMHFSWDLIDAVVVKKYSVTILTNTACYFFFDISQKDKIVDLLKKYKHEDLLVEKNK